MSRTALLLLVLALAPLALAGEEPAVPVPAAPVPGESPVPAQPAAPPDAVPEWAKVSDAQKVAAKETGVPVAFENSLGMRFVLIPAGTLQMGSPTKEEGRQSVEVPHGVVLTRPFYMANTEVTNGEYRKWKGEHDSGSFQGHSLSGVEQPVARVSWTDAKGFADWVSVQEGGRAYRLPTEAEWEWACRAGTRTRYWWGDSAEEGWRYANANDPQTKKAFGLDWAGWSRDDGHRVTAPVGSYPPNPWGLHDMLGNVMEWCSDWYAEYPRARQTDPSGPASGWFRLLRGGYWADRPAFVRSGYRYSDYPELLSGGTGFRLVSPLPVPSGAPSSPPASRTDGVPPWANVCEAQGAAAKRARVPVAFENSIGMRFVLIPAGTFTMGSPTTEEGRWADEAPHEVVLSKPFYLGITEVTNGQYRQWREEHDSGSYGSHVLNGDEQPAVDVSWEEANAFAEWLSGREGGRTYRLPTEAEWERACRAGTQTRYWWGDAAEEGWRYANSCDPKTKEAFGFNWAGWSQDDGYRVNAPVGRYAPNPWGLCDMSGNVWEWCSDWYAEYPRARKTDPRGPATGGERVLRGGAWSVEPRRVRSAHRFRSDPNTRDGGLGFRLVVPLPSPSGSPPVVPGGGAGRTPTVPPPVPTEPVPDEPRVPAPLTPAGPPEGVPEWAKVSDAQKAAAKEAGVPVAFENGIGMRFVLIPAGTFLMGSPTTEKDRDDDEVQHEVVLTKPFYLGVTEVTNAQYRRWKPDHESGPYGDWSLNGDTQPVVWVSWEYAAGFAEWLNAQDEGRTYRLPTEAEWEYACRAGTQTTFSWGDSADEGWRYANANDPRTREPSQWGGDAWSKDDGYRVTAPVGSFPPNPWGLYDMHGNVSEWCSDRYGEYPTGRLSDPSRPANGEGRVHRGGSWFFQPSLVRSAGRCWLDSGVQFPDQGFRLVSPLPESR